jgi:hypothetical protein
VNEIQVENGKTLNFSESDSFGNGDGGGDVKETVDCDQGDPTRTQATTIIEIDASLILNRHEISGSETEQRQ